MLLSRRRQLTERLESRKPQHLVIEIGSGRRKTLGFFLRRSPSYRPAVHCVGAALGFLTGDQAVIPGWADRFYLGWLFRLVAQSRIFVPRLTRAVQLPLLIVNAARICRQ
jgi:N-acetylglucosaminyldiphosphoundecaprenol N-acetyl-beta-D-mannosaminyltransferase